MECRSRTAANLQGVKGVMNRFHDLSFVIGSQGIFSSSSKMPRYRHTRACCRLLPPARSIEVATHVIAPPKTVLPPQCDAHSFSLPSYAITCTCLASDNSTMNDGGILYALRRVVVHPKNNLVTYY